MHEETIKNRDTNRPIQRFQCSVFISIIPFFTPQYVMTIIETDNYIELVCFPSLNYFFVLLKIHPLECYFCYYSLSVD